MNQPVITLGISFHPPRRALGFTLVESLVVMTIAALLAVIAIPSFRGVMTSIKVSSASNSLLSYMHLARSEAIKRNSRVALCKSADGMSCASSGGWEQGLIVFHDVNNNGLFDAGETVIERAQAFPPNLRMIGNVNVARYVSFTGTGATRLIGGGFQAGTLTVCNESSSSGEARQIILNAVGRPRIQKVALGACV